MEEGREKERRQGGQMDGRASLALPCRNIKLNKRSIFCSLFLTGVELRHFATLFFPPPGSSGLPSSLSPSPPLRPCSRSSTLFLPLADSLLLLLFLPLPLPSPAVPLFFALLASTSFSLRPVRRNEPRRGEALYQSRVRSAWFIFYFGRGPNCKINTSS